MRIACIGDNTIDYYDAAGKGSPGGNSVNVAVYLRRLGVDSSYIGAVGSDAYGQIVFNALKEKEVDVSRVRVLKGNTAVCHVSIENGERSFGKYDEGVLADFRPDEEDISFLLEHDLVVTAVWGHSETVLREIWRHHIPTAFDASNELSHPAALTALPFSTAFFFSDDISSDDIVKDKLRSLQAHGPEIVIAMRGEKGSIAFDGSTFYEYGTVQCEVVDTNGAGDSYIAGFLKAWLEKMNVEECMYEGAKNASVTICYSGAW